MQNLVCRKHTYSSLEKNSDFEIVAATWDVITNTVIAALRSKNEEEILLLLRCKTDDGFIDPTSGVRLASFECPDIIDFHYLPDKSWICLVTTVGDLIIVREEPIGDEEKIEIVGSVDAGIAAARWSPDEELLILVTKVDTILFMTQDFECLNEYTCNSEDLKISKHVDVGWGKEETQFKGRKARTLQDPTIPKTVDKGALSDGDTGKVSVSWRGDGAFVAINSVESNSRRVIRVLSREATLDSVSEPVDGLTGALSWRPTGNLIASVQKRRDCVQVVFFERNGLRHGEFDLRLMPEEIDYIAKHDIHLSWNVDSTVLGVNFHNRVQLWTMKNYHYYLKQDMPMPPSVLERPRQVWHPEAPMRFLTLHSDAFDDQVFQWKVATNPVLPGRDYGIVAVIDGAKVEITSMRLANIPPPMSQHSLHMPVRNPPSPPMIRDVQVICQEDHTATIYVLLHAKLISYSWNLRQSDVEPSVEWRCDLRENTPTWNVTDILKNTKAKSEQRDDILPQLDLPPFYMKSSKERWHESIFRENPQSDGVEHAMDTSPSNLSKPINYFLSDTGALIANNRVLTKGCTSFIDTPNHLIYTHNSILKFIHKTSKAEDLEVPPDDSDERTRQIERGAILVTAMPSTYSVVIQMPRGNLETVYPRVLVMAGIRRHIDEGKYKAAFLACRKQRIDMNILHDYEPARFFRSISAFVDQLNKPEYIDLFVSSLKEEDVSRTMYLDTLPSRPPKMVSIHEPSQGSLKVNNICDGLLKILLPRPDRVQNVITAYVCKTPPDLDAALGWVAGIEDDERVEKAVEHICFLADVNRLFDHALGLYNLQLALQIAEQSQKDPREYMPFLERLQDTKPEERRRFEIDDHLKRHAKALESLYPYSDFENFQAYVVKHCLYEQAIQITLSNSTQALTVTGLHAKHLQAHAHYGKAGEAYRTTEDFSSASDCFRLAHRSQESLECAQLAHFSITQSTELANVLAEDLIESKDYSSAAQIQEHHLHDLPAAARLYCKAYNFPEAERTIALTNDPNLLETILDEGLKAAFATLSELLSDCKSQLHAQVPRIRELREKKSQNPLAYLEGDSLDQKDGQDIPDNVSLADTEASTVGASLFTRYTGAQSGTVGTNVTRQTSKNRRREERKRARGKKGSVYEEEYLVNSVRRLIERVNSIHEDLAKVLKGLQGRGMVELGEALKSQMDDVIVHCRSSAEVIFEEMEDAPQILDFEEGVETMTTSATVVNEEKGTVLPEAREKG